MILTPLPWIEDDGGRASAGYRGEAGDCVTRAVAIATDTPYLLVYTELLDGSSSSAERAKLLAETERESLPDPEEGPA